MRQRLSSEPDRYRGRRRVPTPPRSRYAVVGLSAFVGAGAVALGAGATMPDAKAVPDTVLQGMEDASVSAEQFAARAENDDKASRDRRPGRETRPTLTPVSDEDLYGLPLEDFRFTAPYGVRWGTLHAGIDLAADEGTPYRAIHGGTVTKAGYNGGYGYAVTVRHDDGSEIVYAHSSKLLVQAGQKVETGDVLGEVGSSGYAYGNHLHIEMRVGGKPVDPARTLRSKGVDFVLKIATPYSAAQ